MPSALTENQLYTALSAEQAAAVRRCQPVPGEGTDPVAQAIATALAKVDAYSTGWAVPAALLTGWACDLAAWAVTNRLTIQTVGQTAAKDRAQRELEDLRDGKFPGIPRTTGGSAATTGRLSYGGRSNILKP